MIIKNVRTKGRGLYVPIEDIKVVGLMGIVDADNATASHCSRIIDRVIS